MAGKGGGAWKVAYADFVTAMMAFFLVMWIVGQDKPVKQAVAQYFEDPLGIDKGSRSTSLEGPEDATTPGNFESGRGTGAASAWLRRRIVGRKKCGRRRRKNIPPHIVIFRHFNRTYSLGTVILFGDDSADLDKAAKERLEQLVPLLRASRTRSKSGSMRRENPWPRVASLEMPGSWRARSMAVRKFLTDNEITPDRIRLTQEGSLEPDTLYMGENKPRAGFAGRDFCAG